METGDFFESYERGGWGTLKEPLTVVHFLRKFPAYFIREVFQKYPGYKLRRYDICGGTQQHQNATNICHPPPHRKKRISAKLGKALKEKRSSHVAT